MRNMIIKKIATDLNEPEKIIRAQLETPWGIHQLVAGKYKELIADERIALKRECTDLAVMIFKLHKKLGVPLDKITEAFNKLTKEYASKKQDSLKKLPKISEDQ